MSNTKQKLRKEVSINCSGKLLDLNAIPLLKEENYVIKNIPLDGDAPKQFIKAYFYKEGSSIRKKSTSSWIPYIAKLAEKWYPHESVIEYMINRIGQVLGLNMNDICLVRGNGQIRFLSKYFLCENEKLIHGAEICGEHLGDMIMAKEIAEHKNTSRELFTFEFIRDAIRSVFPGCFEDLLRSLVKMIAFDAIVGNNDRHFYNWGIIDTKKKTAKMPTFAPVYDSARGLLWNLSDDNVKHYLKLYLKEGKKIPKYIDVASPRISIEGNTQANHFELIDFLKRYNVEYAGIIEDLACFENEERVLKMLKTGFFGYFIPERCELITVILKLRFKKIREI